MTFSGFDPRAIELLDQLPGLDADGYGAVKSQLTAGLIRPGAALIAAVADRLDADLTVVPRSSVSPLHRDLRFAAAGAPKYKDHLLLTTWEGADKHTSPMFWIRIDAHRAGFASGMGFTPAVRDAWRSAVAGDAGEVLATELGRLVADRQAMVAGDQVKNVPVGHDPAHPRADLLRHTGFQVRFIEDLPATIGAPAFADWCTERLAALLPVHRWLVDHLC
jgi:uncharacterized protein (DUF2461 family)